MIIQPTRSAAVGGMPVASAYSGKWDYGAVPNSAKSLLGVCGPLSGNIGSLSLPVRALDGNVLWSGRKVSESDSDVQRQSRGRISRAQTDRAATSIFQSKDEHESAIWF